MRIPNLAKYSRIGSVTQVIYAAVKQKKIVIFCDSKITSYDVEGEYWFPILTCTLLNQNVDIKFVNNENEIINYIHELKE